MIDGFTQGFFCLPEPGAMGPCLWEKIARKSIKLGKSDLKFKAICKYFGLPLTCSTIYFFIFFVNLIYYN